jgi:hypothetical protein
MKHTITAILSLALGAFGGYFAHDTIAKQPHFEIVANGHLKIETRSGKTWRVITRDTSQDIAPYWHPVPER